MPVLQAFFFCIYKEKRLSLHMNQFNPYKQFQSGKHVNKTYWWVWEHDKPYLYYLAGQYSYWHDVVEMLEYRDRFINGGKERRNTAKPVMSTQEFKEFFAKHPIMGFDMSEWLASVYDELNDSDKQEYFELLKKRNNIK